MHLNYNSYSTYRKYFVSFFIPVLLLFAFASCEKELKLKYKNIEIKQVIISNLSPNANLRVNISKSKEPNDYSSVQFLSDCKVDIYENDIFIETLPFILKDTLSGLGYYTSTFKLQQNKTYKIISTHPTLGVAEAAEYLPGIPSIANFALLQHADSLHSAVPGQYILVFRDSAAFNNYYYLSTYYRVLKPTINSSGDTIYKYDYIFNIPSYTPEIPNLNNYTRLFTTDRNFDGQQVSLVVDFPSQYNTVYKEILLVVELSNCGKNYFDWNVQQLYLGIDFLNEGQSERINLKSNIVNGFGHFTANSSVYIGIPIK